MALSQNELTQRAYAISELLEKVNTFYLTKMARQIKEIGQLNPSNMKRLEQMAKMSMNVDEISLYLSKQTGYTLQEIYNLFQESAGEIYKDVAYLYKAGGVKQVPFSKNITMQEYIRSIEDLTANTFKNLSNTTVIYDTYRNVIDEAIMKVVEGVDDYSSAMRSILKSVAQRGLRVQYASGRTRRLDSATRMNILEGVRQVNYGIRKEAGKQYGADGVEIDAHGLCAEDHLPYQGKQYTIQKYNEINDGLKRKFGTCNCQHGISYIIIGISPPTYSQNELDDIRDYSTKKVQIGDKEVTRYEASQLMRQAETQMRYKKDEIIALKAAGMDTKKEEAELRELQKQYRYIASQSDLKKRYDRAYVPGYK